MKFCSKCGKEIMDEAVICIHCGCAVSNTQQSKSTQEDYEDALNTFENRSKSAIAFWKVLGIIQICIGAIWVISSFIVFVNSSMNEDFITGFAPFFASLMLLAVGLSNVSYAKQSTAFLESVKSKPVGIIKRYDPISPIISHLILNVIFGFAVGVIGCIFDFATRNYVMNNRRIFKEIEAQREDECQV